MRKHKLVAEMRTPLPTAPGRPARFDYEYERRGVSAVFMLYRILSWWCSMNGFTADLLRMGLGQFPS